MFIDALADLVIAWSSSRVVAWQIFVWGMKMRESGEVSETLKIIYHPFVFGVAVGFAVTDLLVPSLTLSGTSPSRERG